MSVGRKPKHAFNSLKIGEKAILSGKAKLYPYQFINQYNKTKDGKLKVVKVGNKLFAERVS